MSRCSRSMSRAGGGSGPHPRGNPRSPESDPRSSGTCCNGAAMDPAPQNPDEQLAQSAWVWRLAQNILRDRSLAEDAEQEGAIAAWQHGPIEAHARASWLATTVRHLAGRILRGETRRSAREHSVARREALPST